MGLPISAQAATTVGGEDLLGAKLPLMAAGALMRQAPVKRRFVRRKVLAASCAIGALAALVLATAPVAGQSTNGSPNVILIVVDDVRWDELGVTGHPYVETPNIDRLAREGALFENAFAVAPLCSPNRASIVSGQYASLHGVVNNVARDLTSHRMPTFPRALDGAGYHNGFVGKWHMGNDPTPRPGFADWAGLPGQGSAMNTELFEDGRLRRTEGYVTDVLNERAVGFVKRPHGGPFFLFLAHKAVHPDLAQRDDGSVALDGPLKYVPAPRHRGRYDDETFPRRPNVRPSGQAPPGKAALAAAFAKRASPEVMSQFGAALDPGTFEDTIRRRAEMLLAIDEGVGQLLAALEARGELDRTMILFTSDHGYFYGEHGLSVERRLPYEEAIRVPLLVRYPPLVDAGTRIEELVLSIDLAPSILDLAGVAIGPQIQGTSFVPVLQGEETSWRKSFLIELDPHDAPMPWMSNMDYRAVRTERYKYIHWLHHPDEPELYDLRTDPHELDNRIDDAALAGVRAELEAELGQLILSALGLPSSPPGSG